MVNVAHLRCGGGESRLVIPPAHYWRRPQASVYAGFRALASGENSADVQEEVLVIALAASHAPDREFSDMRMSTLLSRLGRRFIVVKPMRYQAGWALQIHHC
jgi:hypothetical protein